MKKYPGISVVITTYNEEKRLGKCLDSIEKQDYPQGKIEIILVDDKSSDKTLEIAKKYTSKIFVSGKRFCEISRAVGIKKASNDLIFFIDADNILPNSDFLTRAVDGMLSEPDVVGSYPWRFHYDSEDPPSNRYCSLFGLNDPFQFYTKAREHISYINEWDILGKPKDKGKYYVVKFPKGSQMTLGAIGFLTRKSLIIDKIYNEFFFHSDVFNELIGEGKNKFVLTKQEIIHNHCDSSVIFLGKLSRNFHNFLKYKGMRESVWAVKNKTVFVKSVLKMLFFVIPLKDSIRGFIEKRDLAWFLHPLYCYAVILMYTYKVIVGKFSGKL